MWLTDSAAHWGLWLHLPEKKTVSQINTYVQSVWKGYRKRKLRSISFRVIKNRNWGCATHNFQVVILLQVVFVSLTCGLIASLTIATMPNLRYIWSVTIWHIIVRKSLSVKRKGLPLIKRVHWTEKLLPVIQQTFLEANANKSRQHSLFYKRKMVAQVNQQINFSATQRSVTRN